jgi:hypothetical protein
MKRIIYSAELLNHLAYCNNEEEKRYKQMNPQIETDAMFQLARQTIKDTLSVGGWEMVHVSDVVIPEMPKVEVKKELGPNDPITLEDDEE